MKKTYATIAELITDIENGADVFFDQGKIDSVLVNTVLSPNIKGYVSMDVRSMPNRLFLSSSKKMKFSKGEFVNIQVREDYPEFVIYSDYHNKTEAEFDALKASAETLNPNVRLLDDVEHVATSAVVGGGVVYTPSLNQITGAPIVVPGDAAPTLIDDRILLNVETDSKMNGIYRVLTLGDDYRIGRAYADENVVLNTALPYIVPIGLGGFTAVDFATEQTAGKFAAVADWITATSYNIGDYVYYNNSVWKCAAAHTSGAFNADHTAGDWTLIQAVVSGDIWARAADFVGKQTIDAFVFYGSLGRQYTLNGNTFLVVGGNGSGTNSPNPVGFATSALTKANVTQIIEDQVVLAGLKAQKAELLASGWFPRIWLP